MRGLATGDSRKKSQNYSTVPDSKPVTRVCVCVKFPFGEIIPANNAEASTQRVRAEVKKCGKTN